MPSTVVSQSYDFNKKFIFFSFISGRFQQFDFGRKRNMKHYGQERPPMYDVSKITVPINLFWAENDWMTGEKASPHDFHNMASDFKYNTVLQLCCSPSYTQEYPRNKKKT